jgi:hypothetical protein
VNGNPVIPRLLALTLIFWPRGAALTPQTGIGFVLDVDRVFGTESREA